MDAANLEHLLSMAGGGMLVLAIARFAILQALGDLGKMKVFIPEIREAIAVMKRDLERLSDHDLIIREHAKRIAYIEGASLASKPLQ